MSKLTVVAILALGLSGSVSADERLWPALDDPTSIIGWSWTCSSKVFYNMEVPEENNPNGSYKAIGLSLCVRGPYS
jgi:hypothetical protein